MCEAKGELYPINERIDELVPYRTVTVISKKTGAQLPHANKPLPPPLPPPQNLVPKHVITTEGNTLKKKNSGTWNTTPVATCISMGAVTLLVDVNWVVESFIVNIGTGFVKSGNTLTILMILYV